MEIKDTVKKAIKDKKLVIGTNSVLKGVKSGKIQTAIHASNTPKEKLDDLNRYAKEGLKLESFKEKSSQLGEICGKPFNVLVVGIKK